MRLWETGLRFSAGAIYTLHCCAVSLDLELLLFLHAVLFTITGMMRKQPTWPLKGGHILKYRYAHMIRLNWMSNEVQLLDT